MSDRRVEKLAEKYREKQNWKSEVANLLDKRKKAEAQLKDASEIIGKVQAKVKDAFDSEDSRRKLPETIAKIVGIEIPEKKEAEPETKEEV